MKKQTLILITVIAIVVIGAILLFSSSNKPASLGNNSNNNSSRDQNNNSPGSPTGSTYNILIQNFAFNPETITIKIGDTVKWMNTDTTKHTVTSDLGIELNSQELSKGQSYSHTFTKAGEYDYHCTIHTSMTAKVIVQ